MSSLLTVTMLVVYVLHDNINIRDTRSLDMVSVVYMSASSLNV